MVRAWGRLSKGCYEMSLPFTCQWRPGKFIEGLPGRSHHGKASHCRGWTLPSRQASRAHLQVASRGQGVVVSRLGSPGLGARHPSSHPALAHAAHGSREGPTHGILVHVTSCVPWHCAHLHRQWYKTLLSMQMGSAWPAVNPDTCPGWLALKARGPPREVELAAEAGAHSRDRRAALSWQGCSTG